MACGAEGAAKGELRVLQAEASYWNGELRAATTLGTEATRGLTTKSPPWFTAIRICAAAAGALGERETLEHVARQLATIDAPPESRANQGWASAVAVAYLLHAGMREHAQVILRRLERFEHAGPISEHVLARMHFARALAAKLDGDPVAYLEGCRAAVDAAMKAGDLRYTAVQLQNCGFALLELGDNEEAASALSSAAPELSRLGLEQPLVSLRINQAVVALRHGDHELALRVVAEAVAMARRRSNQRQEGIALDLRAQALVALGRAPEAFDDAARAVELLAGVTTSRPHARAVMAGALVALGRMDDALTSARAAANDLDTVKGSSFGGVFIRWTHARIARAANLEEEMRGAVVKAVELIGTVANRISDPRKRATFLAGIPENRGIVDLATELKVGGRW